MDKDIQEAYDSVATNLSVYFNWEKDELEIVKIEMVGQTKAVGICSYKAGAYAFVLDKDDKTFNAELRHFRS